MIVIMLKELQTAFKKLPGVKQQEIAADSMLFAQGNAVKRMYLLSEGEVHLIRVQPNGESINLQRAKSGDIIAEASLYSSHYHCHAYSKQKTKLFAVAVSQVIHQLKNDANLSQMWMTHLAHEMQKARFRSELLSIKTVSARLDAWLNWKQRQLPEKGEWKTLAEQLGVSPEALYREIGKRQKRFPKY